MPLPTPSKGEDRDAFISRCMSALKGEFPDQDQRLAVCFKQFRGGKQRKLEARSDDYMAARRRRREERAAAGS